MLGTTGTALDGQRGTDFSALAVTPFPAPARAADTLQLLVVDDDASVRKACCEIAVRLGYQAVAASSVDEARSVLKRQPVDVVLLDLRLPGDGGLALLAEATKAYPRTGVVVMTAYATVSTAVDAMRTGAADYLTKPFGLDQLKVVLERAVRRRTIEREVSQGGLLTRPEVQTTSGDLVGRTPEMERLHRMLIKVAAASHPALILGESGTGKELVARSIHARGPNAMKPFVTVDCGSLVPTLIESELFGHIKGAFTGADRAKVGLLAAAGGGTVFLDEIGELPLDLQTKLLRALQEKEVRPVGSTQPVPFAARILAATNRDLFAMVEQGRFRKDLYYRLNVVSLKIPALRERRMDIVLLTEHFLGRIVRQTGRPRTISEEAMRVMMEYPWPGNIRELEHAIERMCAMESGASLGVRELPSPLLQFLDQEVERLGGTAAANRLPVGAAVTMTGGGVISIASLEKRAILATVEQVRGDKILAAKLLGIGKTTLYRKLKEYGITVGD